MMAVNRLSRMPSVMLLLAGCWSAALITGGFFLPIYHSAGVPAGHGAPGPETLTGVNGAWAVAVIAVPLLVVLVVGVALWRGPRRVAVVIAWVTAGILAVVNLLALASVGVFILPVTVALIVACSTQRPSRAAR